jgi:thiamine pyrophosphate-dependent acetolactate synthase large subunit-like protein
VDRRPAPYHHRGGLQRRIRNPQTVRSNRKTSGVPGLDLPGLDIVATAASYGVTASQAHDTDELVELFRAGITDRDRPTLINVTTTPIADPIEEQT